MTKRTYTKLLPCGATYDMSTPRGSPWWHHLYCVPCRIDADKKAHRTTVEDTRAEHQYDGLVESGRCR